MDTYLDQTRIDGGLHAPGRVRAAHILKLEEEEEGETNEMERLKNEQARRDQEWAQEQEAKQWEQEHKAKKLAKS
jgi:hypothetical protein